MFTLCLIKKLLAIALGAAILASSINGLIIANSLADGGVAGLGVLFKYLFDINPGLTVLVLNIPLLVWGYFEFGLKSLSYTIWGVITLSFFLWYFDDLSLVIDDLLLVALYAGVTMGIGLGIVFRFGGTTGGVDIIARILNKRVGFGMGSVLFYLDFGVLTCSLLVLNLQQFIYTLVMVFIATRVVDTVQQGAYKAKAVTVVSSHESDIAKAVMSELGRGVTILKGVGAYTQTKHDVLYVVCTRYQIVRVKNLIYKHDPAAFVTITDVHEVIGEGFNKVQTTI